MSGIIGELLVVIVRGFIVEVVYVGFFKVGVFIDCKISRGCVMVIIGMLMGLVVYVFIFVFFGVFGL